MKYLLLFFLSFSVFASDNLLIEVWPKKQSCDQCVSIQAYGQTITVAGTVRNITMLPTLGLNVELENKKFFISTPPESSLLLIKKNLKINSWVAYHNLVSIKSNNKKIEQFRNALEITSAKAYYKFENKTYTVFFIDRENATLGTSSELMIIPKNKFKIVKIGGNFSKNDAKLIISNFPLE